MRTLLGIAAVAAAATLGDFIWYTVGVRHTVLAGVTDALTLERADRLAQLRAALATCGPAALYPAICRTGSYG